MLSFTAEVYFSLLAQYNRAVWPVPALGVALGLGAIGLVWRPAVWGDRIVAAILGAAWLWVGIAFHWAHFATISFTAPVIAICFVVQGLLLLWVGVARNGLRFRLRPGPAGQGGIALAIFGLALYPLLGLLAGHEWRQLALFGAAPAPTVIVTIGLLLLVDGRRALPLIVLPVLWSLAAGLAAWFLVVTEMLVLPGIALLGVALGLWKLQYPDTP